MKRLNNLWDSFVSRENMIQAIYEGTQFKHKDPMVIKKLTYSKADYEKDPKLKGKIDPNKVDALADKLIRELTDGTYFHRKPLYKHLYCQSKSMSKGKWRHIYCPSLYDHVIHHAIMQVCMPAFMGGMIEQCCGSVPKRGTGRVREFVERWVRSDDECKYFVKLDIRRFFDSIPRDGMIECLSHHIKDQKILAIWIMIIDSAPSAAPVGYYTSPWLGNLYLESLDHFIKQSLYKERRGNRINYVKHYCRYVDDMLLMGSSKRDLEKAIKAIKKHLDCLSLDIKECWEIKRIAELDENHRLKKGTYRIDICGYAFDRETTRLRAGIYLSTMRLARKMNKQRTQKKKYSLHDCQSLMSKVGWAVHADSTQLLTDINKLVDIETTKEVISNAAKRGISRQTR